MGAAEVLIPITSIIAFFSAVITYIYMKYKSRHTERMALIESGETADIFDSKSFSGKEQSLKNGLFLIGGGSGFVSGTIIESVLHLDDAIAMVPLTIVGAGLGLVIFYRIMSNKED